MLFLVISFFVVIIEFGNNFSFLFRLFLSFGLRFNLCFSFYLDLFFNGGFFLDSFFLCFLLNFLAFGFFVFWLTCFILVLIEFVRSSELSWHVSNTGPVFYDLFLLSSHFDKESSVEDFLVVMIFDEVDSVNSHLKDDFEGSWVVIFHFDQIVFGESFSDVVFGGIEITFDKVEGNVIEFLIEVFDGLDKLVSAWD
jgi:hypothetical protein